MVVNEWKTSSVNKTSLTFSDTDLQTFLEAEDLQEAGFDDIPKKATKKKATKKKATKKKATKKKATKKKARVEVGSQAVKKLARIGSRTKKIVDVVPDDLADLDLDDSD
jgi:hypothetical protein